MEKDGVTVIVPIIGLAVLLDTLNALMVPEPNPTSPIAVFEFVQLYDVVPPELIVEKATVVMLVPVHKI